MPRRKRARSDAWAILALVLYALGIAAWLLLNGVPLTRQDGFYYFEIARNVARGFGSTFDGLHVTNGYHPLWLLCLVPVFWVSSEPHAALRLGILLQGSLMAAATAVLYQTARLTQGRLAASLAALLWLALTCRESLSGMEFSLHALGILAAAYVYLRRFERELSWSPRHYLCLGLLLALTFLARLDTLFLAGVIGASLASREAKGGMVGNRAARVLAFSLPIAVVCVGYIVFNLWLCGHPWPVSGAVKREWSLYALAQDPHYRTGGWCLAKAQQVLWPIRNLHQRYSLYLSIGTFGAPLLLLAGMRCVRPLAPFAAYSLLQFLGYALVYHEVLVSSWYFVVQPWLTVLLVGAAADWAADLGRSAWMTSRSAWARLILPVLLIGWCLVPLRTFGSLAKAREVEETGPTYDGARWVQANLPADSIIGSWNLSAIAFLSGRRVVNLDGLVNSWEFYRSGRQDLCRYWDEAGITYLIDIFSNRRAAVSEPTYAAYARCLDRLDLVWSGRSYGMPQRVEVYRVLPPKE